MLHLVINHGHFVCGCVCVGGVCGWGVCVCVLWRVWRLRPHLHRQNFVSSLFSVAIRFSTLSNLHTLFLKLALPLVCWRWHCDLISIIDLLNHLTHLFTEVGNHHMGHLVLGFSGPVAYKKKERWHIMGRSDYHLLWLLETPSPSLLTHGYIIQFWM